MSLVEDEIFNKGWGEYQDWADVQEEIIKKTARDDH